jgi:hypothetical protein
MGKHNTQTCHITLAPKKPQRNKRTLNPTLIPQKQASHHTPRNNQANNSCTRPLHHLAPEIKPQKQHDHQAKNGNRACPINSFESCAEGTTGFVHIEGEEEEPVIWRLIQKIKR